MILPFSPWTQALSPDLEPTADASLRTCFRDQLENSVATGRAFLPDATPEDEAIVKEPLFRRPCQVSSGDCPFATAYENVDSFFNCASTLALLCKCLSARHNNGETSPVDYMHDVISMFVNGHQDLTPVLACWATDALILINSLYPSNIQVGELALMNAFAKAVPACHQGLRSGSVVTLESVPGIEAVDVRYARIFWSSFCRDSSSTCAWKCGLKPLLQQLLDHDGSHKKTPEVIAAFKERLENAVKAVWLVHSPDGVSPPPSYNPASSAKSAAHIGRNHIDPCFVGCLEQGIKQRASSIGLKPHTYRQVLMELAGASIEGVEVNVAINEGGLSLRVSSDPTILDEKGHERTEKSISPVQTEGDSLAYGTRADKIAGAVAQKSAWDVNALLGKPLFTSFEAPKHPDIRARGEFGTSQFFVAEGAKMANEGQRMSKHLVCAKNMISAASEPTVARSVNSRLYSR